ncbi:hypothetical protein J8J40_29725, partial [Mycobacterium tuberculosis]|nr:hypothetical protein [Mycobacterium tuberculosis]MBR7503949.1 hypothetical protein [Mycobacterium tuberculosis]
LNPESALSILTIARDLLHAVDSRIEATAWRSPANRTQVQRDGQQLPQNGKYQDGVVLTGCSRHRLQPTETLHRAGDRRSKCLARSRP